MFDPIVSLFGLTAVPSLGFSAARSAFFHGKMRMIFTESLERERNIPDRSLTFPTGRLYSVMINLYRVALRRQFMFGSDVIGQLL